MLANDLEESLDSTGISQRWSGGMSGIVSAVLPGDSKVSSRLTLILTRSASEGQRASLASLARAFRPVGLRRTSLALRVSPTRRRLCGASAASRVVSEVDANGLRRAVRQAQGLRER